MNLIKQIEKCDCGYSHLVRIEDIIIEQGLLGQIGEFIVKHGLGSHALLVADNNTWFIAGKQVKEALLKAGVRVSELVYQRQEKLVADEYALGELALSLADKPDYLVSIGAGTITDITRYGATISGLPYIVVPTAPSMDGYASAVAPLITKGFKKTFPAKLATAIYADLTILSQAPTSMIQAGFGDLIGKITAKADWLLAHNLKNEYYCAQVQEIVDQAVLLSIKNPQGCYTKDLNFIENLTEGLILSGIAIGMVGNSRPASGGEHHLAHYWEMKEIQENVKASLHGQKVGVASVLISMVYAKINTYVDNLGDPIYQEVFDKLGQNLPQTKTLIDLLNKAEAPVNFHDIAIPLEWVKAALLEAMYLRDRYTILRFADSSGMLTQIAEEIILDISKSGVSE